MNPEIENNMETTTGETLVKGAIGTVGPIALAVVQVPQVEVWMRIVSLGVGIAVGILTIISLVRNMRRKQ